MYMISRERPDDPAEMAELCRTQAELTTNPGTAKLLRQLAEHYEERARNAGKRAGRPTQ